MKKRIAHVLVLASVAASSIEACGSSSPPAPAAPAHDASAVDDDGARPPSPRDGSAPVDASEVDAARPAPQSCGEDVAPNADCSAYALGARCAGGSVGDAGGGGCCVCGALSCSRTWLCGSQATNDPRCPATRPAASLACAVPSGIACSYCSDATPTFARCAPAAENASCAAGGPTPCWSVTPVGGICD